MLKGKFVVFVWGWKEICLNISCSGGILLFTIFWWELMEGIKPKMQFSLPSNQYRSLFNLCKGIIMDCLWIKDVSLLIYRSLWLTKFLSFVFLFCAQMDFSTCSVYASQPCLSASLLRSLKDKSASSINLSCRISSDRFRSFCLLISSENWLILDSRSLLIKSVSLM